MLKYKDKTYREFRCSNCRKLLAMEYIYAGRLSIKCPFCNTFNDMEFKSSKQELASQEIIRTEIVSSGQ